MSLGTNRRAPICCRFLPKDLAIVGYARSALDINDLRKKIKGFLKSKDEAKKEEFVKHVTYVQGAYDKPEAFENLQNTLEEREQKSDGGPVGRLYYLALPPSVYPQVRPKRHLLVSSSSCWPRL